MLLIAHKILVQQPCTFAANSYHLGWASLVAEVAIETILSKTCPGLQCSEAENSCKVYKHALLLKEGNKLHQSRSAKLHYLEDHMITVLESLNFDRYSGVTVE